MVIVGDGPDLDELRDVMQPFSKVLFTGRVKREILPSIYSAADLFMFPSTTDTFGMVVLEAQACGLPAIVSDVGGPQEIIKNGRTGFVARHNSLDDWFVKTQEMIALIQTDPAAYTLMKRQARRRAMIRHGKTSFFDQVDVSAVTSQKYANGEPARRNQRPRNRTAGTSHILEAGSLSG
jgi:glycosyltransferase involved in cell wall biosynthesis